MTLTLMTRIRHKAYTHRLGLRKIASHLICQINYFDLDVRCSLKYPTAMTVKANEGHLTEQL